MKAIILSGGKGTRLRPLTEDIPKPLVPFNGDPLLFRIIRQLNDVNIYQVMLTLGHKADQIKDAIAKENFGEQCKIYFSEEESPLGTAGGVLNCKDFITEDTLIISGDCVIDENLYGFIEHFKHTDVLVSVATTTQADPREFGTILTDSTGMVKAFVEKPTWEQVRTDQINTGIYLIRPGLVPFIEHLNCIPCDFGKNVFPEMLRKGHPIQTYLLQGYWCDIGSPESYLYAHQKITNQPSEGNVIWTETTIDASAKIEGSVICNNVQIGKNVIIRNSFIGSHTVIEDGSCIMNAKIDGRMCIAKGTIATGIVTKSPRQSTAVLQFGDGELVGTFSYEFLSKLCRVVAHFYNETDSIGIVYENNHKAMTVGTWIQAGLMAGGREVRYQNGISLPAFRWMIREGICDGGIYITENRIKLLNGHGNDLNKDERRKLHHLYQYDSGEAVSPQFYGAYTLNNPEEYYYSMLMKHFPVRYYDFSNINTNYSKARKSLLITRYILQRFPDAPIFVSQYSGYLSERLAQQHDRYIVHCGSKIGDMMEEMEQFMHIPGVYEQYLMYTDEFAFCLGVYATTQSKEDQTEECYTFQSEFVCPLCDSIHLLGKICNQYGVENLSEEGFVQRNNRGNVHIAADHDANQLRLYVESFNEEFGKELLTEWEKRLHEIV